MSDLRLAYHEAGRAVRLADTGLTGEQLRQAIERIVETWNGAIPRNRVRIVNQPRYVDLLGALRVCSADEIVAAIEWYGRQQWQRQRNAWCTFDAFLQEDRLTQWVESSIEHGQLAAEADTRQQAATAASEAKRKTDNDASELRRLQAEAFDAMAAPRKYKLLVEAKRALPRSLQKNAGQVRLRAIAMMAQQGKDSHGHEPSQ